MCKCVCMFVYTHSKYIFNTLHMLLNSGLTASHLSSIDLVEKKDSFIAEAHSPGEGGLMSQKTSSWLPRFCSEITEGKEEETTCLGEGYGVCDLSSWTVFWLVGSKISQYYQPSASNQSEVYKLWGSTLLISSTLQCFQFLQNSLKILPCISLDGDPGLCPKAAPLFLLTAPL